MSTTRINWLRLFNYLLVISALAWVSHLIYGEWPTLEGQLLDVYWPGILAILGFGSIYTLHSAFIFAALLHHHTQKAYPFMQIGRLLFTGQLIRHIPGRFFGVVFQISETRKSIPTSIVININIEMMVVTILYALLAAGSVIFYTLISPWVVSLFVVATIVGINFILRNNLAILFLIRIVNFLPTQIAKKLPDQVFPEKIPYIDLFKISLYQLSAFTFYYFGWKSFSIAWPQYETLNLLLLGATYLIAWLAGFLSIVTPGGLGVREAVFLLISPATNYGLLAIITLLARVWFLVNDFILFLVFFVFGRAFKFTQSDND